MKHRGMSTRPALWRSGPSCPKRPRRLTRDRSPASRSMPTAPPQNLDPSYLKDLLKAIQSQNVSGNPALSSLA